jgi:hypothetical protein
MTYRSPGCHTRVFLFLLPANTVLGSVLGISRFRTILSSEQIN